MRTRLLFLLALLWASPALAQIGTPVACWSMNEVSDGTTSVTRTDSGPNMLHLSANNGLESVPGTVGDAARAQSFNSNYLYHAYDALLSPGDTDYAIAGWFYVDTLPAFDAAYTVVSVDSPTLGHAFQLDVYNQLNDATARLRFYVNGASDASDLVQTASSLIADTWYFVTVSYTAAGNGLSMRVDGGTAITSAALDPTPASTAPFRIGAQTNPGDERFFDGDLDEFAFFSNDLTTMEEDAIYNSGAGETCATINPPAAPPPGTAGHLLLLGVGR